MQQRNGRCYELSATEEQNAAVLQEEEDFCDMSTCAVFKTFSRYVLKTDVQDTRLQRVIDTDRCLCIDTFCFRLRSVCALETYIHMYLQRGKKGRSDSLKFYR